MKLRPYQMLMLLFVLFSRAGAASPTDSSKYARAWTRLQDHVAGSGAGGGSVERLIPLRSNGTAGWIGAVTVDTPGTETSLVAYYLCDAGRDSIAVLPLARYRVEGVIPRIRLAFFANADRDPEPELVLQVGWHYDDANAVGWFYETYIYQPAGQSGYKYDPDSRKIIPEEIDALRQGQRIHARYNTESGIRRRLRQLGFR